MYSLRHFMSDVQCEDSSRDNLMLTPFLSQVAAVLDVMGEASAKAQGLKTAITSGKSSQKSGKMRVAMEGGPRWQRVRDKPSASLFPLQLSSNTSHQQYSGLGLGNLKAKNLGCARVGHKSTLDKYFNADCKL